ncbi:hypothetical protein N7582_003468 [Saccharomyces uvarum]|uniref:Manganese resistance protein MNR2 n=1 Tax=Saccharomyces uvarum TaxID=230603 RepID=A0AA35NI61_SACUV|nr:hypothetical protein N7582_003468 [Saccharomyces uvarum]CAI4045219.1 hypothetical protein SUVC_11G1520 [Saccharomyces uvarum]
MSTDNSQKNETVPLLSPYSSSPQLRKKKRNQKGKKNKFVGHLKSDSRRPTQLLHDSVQHDHGQVTDFDQIDSWGMLHESDSTNNDVGRSEDPSLKGAYIDHRPSMSQPRDGSQSASSTARPQPIMKFSTPSYKKPTGVWPSDPNRSLVSDLSPSELESWLKRRKSVHKGAEEVLPADRRQSNANNDVVIDVDALMNHVHNNTSNGATDNTKKRKKKKGSDDNSNKNSKSSSSDSNGEEDEYNSRPSSSLSSNNSSLDDVCLVLDDESSEMSKLWPDCTVLEEFSKEETERLRSQAIQDAEAFHFQYDEDDEDGTSNEDGILFSKPIVTNIDVPELGNRRVNETENLKNGRLRPKRITPWHLIQRPTALGSNSTKDSKSRIQNGLQDNLLVGRNIQYPPHIISNNPEHFRFTYFRVDLDSTVHSPTISGLLQPGQKFQDLFVSSVYSQESNSGHVKTHPNSPTPGMKGESSSQLQGLITKNPSTLSAMSVANMEDIPPFWLDVSNPTEEEMKILSKAFGIHPLTTEDIFLGEVREKVELFRDYYLICFRSFDIVAEKHVRRRKKEKQESATLDHESIARRKSLAYGAAMSNDSNANNSNNNNTSNANKSKWLPSILRSRRRSSANRTTNTSSSSYKRRVKSEKKKMEENEKFKRKSGDRHKPREGELEPLNVYIIVFRTGVLTFHFAPTPHPINVRRRARLLKDYLNVTSDWIAYALIDDITDAFAPMIELIEDEVYEIEDAILKMHQSDDSSDSGSSDSDSDSGSSDEDAFPFDVYSKKTSYSSAKSSASSRSTSSSETSFNANLIGWKRKGDMLRRIGECRKRVMSILRLLGSKADVIKGFAKRYNEQWEASPQSEIAMYLGDIQDHIVTMVSSLNHYEKLLSRSHSNYLAQINIDMTKVNNDMNDVLGKITILGTIVLPMNVITGLWGMNVIVPGQYRDSLTWFMGIVLFMCMLACSAYVYTRKRFGL